MIQSKVLLGFIIFIGSAVGYLYYSQTSEIFVDTGGPPISQELEKFDKIKLDFSILEDERFKALEVYGEIPVNPGVTGRRNIFAPIE